MFFFLLLILPAVRTLQEASPATYVQRPHQLPFNAVQFLQHKEQDKQGPILFPNDAPPPPPTPLIVTSRPLSESIARSELNPNNSVAAQSQYNQVTLRPSYLARGKNYEPYSYTLATVTPVYDYDNANIIQERKENYFNDYKIRLMEFFTPKKPDSKGTEVLVQALQRRRFDQAKPSTLEDKYIQKRVTQKAPIYVTKAQYTTTDYYYEDEFNEEDNNFDFDFKKLYTSRKKQQLEESNSSEYLEYYPDSRKIQRRQYARLVDENHFKIRPLQSLNKNSNGNAWQRLSDLEETKSSSVEEIGEIAQILGLPTKRHNVMRSVKYVRNDFDSLEKNTRRFKMDAMQRNTLDRGKPQLRVVKPLYVQRQQNTVPKADPFKYKNSPEQYYHSKNKDDEHDYNQVNDHGDNYAFSYTVKDHKTGDDFSHSQKSTGSATNGEYRVRLPDGRMQIVSYTADENGYKADVRYDDHQNQDSVDFDHGRDKSSNNNYRPEAQPKYGYNQYFLDNEDFRHPQPTPYKANLANYEQRRVENINDYRNNNDNNFNLYNVYPTKGAFVDTTANTNDRSLDGISDNNNDYLEQYNTHLESNDKVERAKDDYKFSDELNGSTEVVDYSSELDHVYQPHVSKFSPFLLRRGEPDTQKEQAQGQVRPSYAELKGLFVTNANGRRNAVIPVSTVRPLFAVTPDNVVAITPKKPIHNLYTNIKNIVTPAPYLFSTPSPSTPSSYLVSTIANLKHQISLDKKPVLSQHFIDKINKYLTIQTP